MNEKNKHKLISEVMLCKSDLNRLFIDFINRLDKIEKMLKDE